MEQKVKFAFEKLVRDKTKVRMADKDVKLNTKKLSNDEYKKELCNKLREEVDEVIQASNTKELINELADVLEVIHAFVKVHKLSISDIEHIRKQRFNLRGGFYSGLYIKSMEAPQSHKYSDYCRRDPKKYPEID